MNFFEHLNEDFDQKFSDDNYYKKDGKKFTMSNYKKDFNNYIKRIKAK